jgi:hypothetical protein
MAIDGADRRDLERAVALLEHPSLVARITDAVGQPIERFVGFLPADASGRLHRTVRSVLYRLLDVSVGTMRAGRRGPAATLSHKVAGGITGAEGGFFGGAALAVELPVTTTVILRSIADIARSEGEDPASLDTRLACLEVFALGGRSEADDGAETGYYAVRAALAKAVSDAAKYIAERGLTQEGAPVVARLIAQIASRFGTVVSEKVAAQAVPVIGAIGGAGVNLLFIDHFQDVARGHFTVRRLERSHGVDEVQQEYERIRVEVLGTG